MSICKPCKKRTRYRKPSTFEKQNKEYEEIPFPPNLHIVGMQNYLTADGNVSEGAVIKLKSVKIGDLKLTNVRTSVVKSQNAPLLLGQSVLGRLGKIEIDNEKRVIRVTGK